MTKNDIGSVLSSDAWCKSMGCKLGKLVYLHKLLDRYRKLSHEGPVDNQVCTTMDDWLRVYNAPDVLPYIEAFGKIKASEKIDV